MNITLHQPLAIHGIGKRENQEDSILPELGKADVSTKIFIVCDGVGGHDKGEVASNLAANEFNKQLNEFAKENIFSTETIMQAFDATQNAFDIYFEKEPKAKGMATTLVALLVDNDGIVSVHCGDSRLYHIRNGEILWQSFDHTVINELLKAGVITQEEADDSKKNRISRAIQGTSVKKTRPDVHRITDIQANDYFMLCSDGVHGSITDAELCDILSSEQDNEKNIAIINELCEANSADNFTAFLIQVKEVLLNKQEEKEKQRAFQDLTHKGLSNTDDMFRKPTKIKEEVEKSTEGENKQKETEEVEKSTEVQDEQQGTEDIKKSAEAQDEQQKTEDVKKSAEAQDEQQKTEDVKKSAEEENEKNDQHQENSSEEDTNIFNRITKGLKNLFK